MIDFVPTLDIKYDRHTLNSQKFYNEVMTMEVAKYLYKEYIL